VNWHRKRLSRIIEVDTKGMDMKGVGRMQRRLVGNGMRVVAASAVLAVGAMMAAPVAGAQSNPIPRAHIYPDVGVARSDIQAALVKARSEHKRVILDFGGDWCPDCQVLNIYFHQSPNAELLEKNFVLVDVNIGHMDQNLDVAHKYGVPVSGVPALAVVDPSGKVIYAQTKEFSSMRHMEPQAVTDFLNKWKQ
jgi:thiol:disulfide interchange protein